MDGAVCAFVPGGVEAFGPAAVRRTEQNQEISNRVWEPTVE